MGRRGHMSEHPSGHQRITFERHSMTVFADFTSPVRFSLQLTLVVTDNFILLSFIRFFNCLRELSRRMLRSPWFLWAHAFPHLISVTDTIRLSPLCLMACFDLNQNLCITYLPNDRVSYMLYFDVCMYLTFLDEIADNS